MHLCTCKQATVCPLWATVRFHRGPYGSRRPGKIELLPSNSSKPFGISPSDPLDDPELLFHASVDIHEITHIFFEIMINRTWEKLLCGFLKNLSLANEQPMILI